MQNQGDPPGFRARHPGPALQPHSSKDAHTPGPPPRPHQTFNAYVWPEVQLVTCLWLGPLVQWCLVPARPGPDDGIVKSQVSLPAGLQCAGAERRKLRLRKCVSWSLSPGLLDFTAFPLFNHTCLPRLVLCKTFHCPSPWQMGKFLCSLK